MTADAVVVGAGIAGVSVAWQLVRRHGLRHVILLDSREPLTLTSDKGTQGYRNWFPGPDDAMVRFLDRSIDLLEHRADESGQAFDFTRPGYLFVTGEPAQAERFRESARHAEQLGTGPMREHPGAAPYQRWPAAGLRDMPRGTDLLTDPGQLRREFPCLAGDVAGGLHVRRAGYVDAPALGRWLLEDAVRAGLSVQRGEVDGFTVEHGLVTAIRCGAERFPTRAVVLAPGPRLAEMARMLELELPVSLEAHAKMTFLDRDVVVPRDAPFLIWTDPQVLPWSEEERARLEERPETRWLTEPFPGGVHVRPKPDPTGTAVQLIWTWHTEPCAFEWPPRFDPWTGEILLRGLSRMLPGMARYAGEGNRGIVDGGYYCKTPENRPLIGPLPVAGAYICAALSGYGLMASQAAAELAAAHLTGSALPAYATMFLPARYRDPAYQALLARMESRTGQL